MFGRGRMLFLCVTGTFLDGEQLEKNGQKKLVQGHSVISVGRCATKIMVVFDKGGSDPPLPLEGEDERSWVAEFQAAHVAK